jgi:hypothetical protein
MKYNGLTNRATWLFNVYYGDKINNEDDFNREKEQCEEEYENLLNTIGTCIWSDMIDIREINFVELFETMSSDWDEFKCEMCEASMTKEDHHFCDICDDCRDEE